ncbi:unnamed protein product [Moneuplotes crassus]|uniref:EF-hand domain-containing protein n=1 Tax=Euplotes crassus TaxID=5936 RepID=A0AAD2D110_EUPCR|nr:unnamed protein product [Moneuplotes crassus]
MSSKSKSDSHLFEASKEINQEESKNPMVEKSGVMQKSEIEGDFRIEYVMDENGKGKKIRKYIKAKSRLTSEQVREIKEAFRLFDRDNSNSIDVAELRDAMKALGIPMTRSELRQMMKEVDTDGSGNIDFEEFKTLMTKKMSERNPIEELRKSFRLYDSDDTGKISFQNLKDAAQDLKEDLTDDEILAMIREADKDGDGEISLDEFIGMMKEAKFF